MKGNDFFFDFEGNRYQVKIDNGEPYFLRIRPFPASDGPAPCWLCAEDVPSKVLEQARYVYHEGIDNL